MDFFLLQRQKLRYSTKLTKKREAETVLTHYLSLVAKGEFTGFETKKSLTLPDLLNLSLDEADARGLRDVYHMRFRAGYLTAFFKDAPVESLTEEAIERYIAERRRLKKSRSTINRELAVLRGALKLAKKKR